MLPCVTVCVMCYSSNGNAKSGSSYQSLVQWTEIPGHPGLICCTTQPGNNPVIMMVRPDSVQLQEIKVASAKAKVGTILRGLGFLQNFIGRNLEKFYERNLYGNSFASSEFIRDKFTKKKSIR